MIINKDKLIDLHFELFIEHFLIIRKMPYIYDVNYLIGLCIKYNVSISIIPKNLLKNSEKAKLKTYIYGIIYQNFYNADIFENIENFLAEEDLCNAMLASKLFHNHNARIRLHYYNKYLQGEKKKEKTYNYSTNCHQIPDLIHKMILDRTPESYFINKKLIDTDINIKHQI